MRVRFLLCVAMLAGCAAPSDESLRRAFDAHRDEFAQVADELARTKALAIGREDGRVRLATDETTVFDAPTDDELSAAHLDRAQYDRVVRLLAEIDAILVERDANTIAIVVDMRGLVPSSAVTSIVRAESPPATLVPDTGVMKGPDGTHCAALEPGWWTCREWD